MAAWSLPVAWHGYAQPAARDREVGSCGVEVMLVAGDGQRYRAWCRAAQLLEPVEQDLFGPPRGHSWRAQFARAASPPGRDPAT
jgi:hypothetical protein